MLARLREIFPSPSPILMYGLTEAFRSTYLDPAQVDLRPDSIGKAIPNAEMLVVRPDGSPCDAGEHGELVHRGALVAPGYWNDPERTALRFRPIPAGGLRCASMSWRSGPAMSDTATRRASCTSWPDRRHDQDLGLPGQPHRDRGGRLRHRAGLRGGGLRRRPMRGWVSRWCWRPPAEATDAATLRKSLEHDLPRYMIPQRIVLLAELPRIGERQVRPHAAAR